MAKWESTYDRIEAYLQGEMSQEEVKAFEMDLETSDALKSEYELHLLADDLVLEQKLSHIPSLVTEVHSVHQKKPWWKNTILISGLVVMLAAVGLVSYEGEETVKAGEDQDPVIEDTSQTIAGSEELSVEEDNHVINKGTRKEPSTIIETKDSTVKVLDSIAKPVVAEEALVTETVSSTEPEAHLDSNEPITEPVGPCLSENLDFSLKTTAECRGESNGEIEVLIAKEAAPMSTLIVKNEYGDEVMEAGLSAGDYTVQYETKQGCKSKAKKAVIGEKRCLKDYSISRQYNPGLTIEGFESTARVVLKTQKGDLYYSAELDAYQSFEWEGVSNDGYYKEGYYLLIINLESGEQLSGTVTLLP